MTAGELPITARSVHVAIDMQELFDNHPDWGIPTARGIIDSVARLAGHCPDRTLWTRFVPAKNATEAKGCWRPYFEQWPRATLDKGARIDLLPRLAPLARPESIFDKAGYSAFDSPDFLPRLLSMQADTLILSGAETDICILSTALNAIDHGFYVVLARDAMTSYSLEAHNYVLDRLMDRYTPQIRVSVVAAILKAWPGAE